ncbi:MAG: hypothetical protein ACF8NJ_00765 [Phycisphaerales bacterium JB038]
MDRKDITHCSHEDGSDEVVSTEDGAGGTTGASAGAFVSAPGGASEISAVSESEGDASPPPARGLGAGISPPDLAGRASDDV